MSDKKNILVTGASGFIGGHIVRHFYEKGEEVTCLLRPGGNTRFIDDLPVKRVKGNILDHGCLDRACKGIDYIIHCAAKVGDWGSYHEFYETNVEGTLNVLNAALKNNIRDVIITGSVSSYGEEHCPELKDESSPYNSHYHYFLDSIFPCAMNHYRDTKALMTSSAIEFAEKTGLNLTVIEPVWVYGENEFSSGFFEYLEAVSSGFPVMPGSKKNLYHVVYAGDLAEAYYQAFKKSLPGIHRFIIGNEKPELMHTIYRQLCKAANLKYPVSLPKWTVYPIAFLMELTYTLLKRKSPPLLTRARVNMFYDSIAFSTEKANQLLNFRCKTDTLTGIQKTVSWYVQHKYLKP